MSPKCQGQGIGQYLIKDFIIKAKEKGYKTVIIQGYPSYYKKLGFKDSINYKITDEDDKFSAGLLIY